MGNANQVFIYDIESLVESKKFYGYCTFRCVLYPLGLNGKMSI